jgi:hypothetical protein
LLHIRFFVCSILFLIAFNFSTAQLQAQASNERVKYIAVTGDTIQIDTLSIIPGSEKIEFVIPQFGGAKHFIVDTQFYDIDYFNSRLTFTGVKPAQIKISYTVFPYLFTQQYFNKDPRKLDSAEINLAPLDLPANPPQPYLDVQGLDYSGSFARGITFGNNQDIVVNSTFNLQMSGKLQNDVEVTASVTDNNIPIQPEGNTQQLQEFDKVFIRLSKNAHSLTVGDYEIFDPPGYFMNFYKKLEGAGYTGMFQNVGTGSLTTSLNLASAKGIYSRQTLAVIEGNQGPYKIRGNNGELFIIILAGTERVFIDGVLLVRGAENDYIIDYNAGEISFTPNVLLTKDKRVTIELEYSDKSYFRTLVFNTNEYSSGDDKLKVRLNIYSEQDSKNQSLDQTLEAPERTILQNAGDSVQYAFASGIDTAEFDASRILYKLIDSLGYDSVFVYSTNPDSAMYALSFSELGINRGNYIQISTLANGRVYQWVAPVAGIPQGTAEPVILLIAPRKTQMITAAADFKINEKNNFLNEIAYTNNDINTFSEIDNADNDGIGYFTTFTNTSQLSNIKIISQLNYEFAAENFIPIERYRPVEFNRDWNIISTEQTNEHYANASFNFSEEEKWNIGLQSSSFIREKNYTGYRQSANANLNLTNWIFTGTGSYLLSDADTARSKFLRPSAALTRIFNKVGGWKVGVRYEGEHNRIFNKADSLNAGSFYYDEYTIFIANPDTAINKFAFDITQRHDDLPADGSFKRVTEATTYNLSGALNKNTNSTFTWLATYRTLIINDTSLTEVLPENSILGRIQHNLVVKKGFFTSDIFYETGSGQEPKREYAYLPVEQGQGVYTWNDYNNNGVAELNEFEISAFADEANYIQVFIPTDEYIQSNVMQLNYSLGINPKALWFNKKGLKELAAKFAVQSSLQLNKKVLDDESINSYNPFAATKDTSLVSSDIFWQNSVYFNRLSPVFGIDYTYQRNFNKQIIVEGAETRGKNEHRIASRYKIFTPLTTNLTFTTGEKRYNAEAFTQKNYFIPYYTIEPKINYTSGSVFRVSTYYEFSESRNTEGAENLTSHAFTIDLRYNVVAKSTLTSKASYINVNYEGDEDTPVGYAILEGLENGNNILWSLNLDRKLSQVLQMTIAYEGRKTGDAAIVHTGRLQMRAVF